MKTKEDEKETVTLKTMVMDLLERVNYLKSLLTKVAQIGAELSLETKTQEKGEKTGGGGGAVYMLANRLASVKPVGR